MTVTLAEKGRDSMGLQDAGLTPQALSRIRALHRDIGIPETFLENTRMPLHEEPAELVATEADFYQRPQRLTPAAHEAWVAMRNAAREEGVVLYLISAYRGIDYQCDLIRKKLQKGCPMEEILSVVAAPGFSEHHTGRALDLHTDHCEVLHEQFENTPAFQWLVNKAGNFGFVLSYPRDNPWGIAFEPWHWCFQPDQAGSRNA